MNGKPESKTVKVGEFEYLLRPAGPMTACAACGKPLDGALAAICPDCGGYFCEECVMDGTFGDHDCGELEDY